MTPANLAPQFLADIIAHPDDDTPRLIEPRCGGSIGQGEGGF